MRLPLHLRLRVSLLALALVAAAAGADFSQLQPQGHVSDFANVLNPAHRAELERYCFQVASTVGVAMAHILGSTSPAALRAATDLGAAMQLTNIVRDVGEDLALGRVYLPQSLLHRYDLSPTTLQAMLRVGPDAGYCAALQSVMSRATSLYAQSLPGIWLLPSRSRLPILLAGRLYARLLPHIERAEYDTLRQRVSTSRRDKLDELRQCVWLLARPPRSVRPPVALPPPAQGGTPWT